ncbi:MAG TPA: TetR family transcriptional regulator [Candidatus Moranbacteria bacterium]|nr:TetR family transcriptional regulator [Candidatus Moranbacteria bacterium]
MKILFISRAFPPVVGGIENQNYELSKWLPKVDGMEVETIANTRGRKFLPFFAPYALAKTLFLLPKYDAVLLGDGVLAVLGWLIKLFSNKPVISVVHGLDINWNSKSLGVWYEKLLVAIYQKLWVGVFLKKIDRFIAVGNETVNVAVKHGISEKKVVFIPNGVDTEKFIGDHSREKLAEILKENLEGKHVILTSGRLAKRKGVAWFIENVMPILPFNVLYVVAGDGPDKANIQAAVTKKNLSDRVKLLGYVSDQTKDVLMNTCDLFIQPNIKIEGDLEGFGISVIEATSCKLPVVASRLEGLKDAIKDQQNGFLVEPHDASGYATKITELLSNETFRKEFGSKARQFAIDNYQWSKIAERYAAEIRKTSLQTPPAGLFSEESAGSQA